MVDAGVFVLLEVGKLFLAHVDHDGGCGYTQTLERGAAGEVSSPLCCLKGNVVNLSWQLSWLSRKHCHKPGQRDAKTKNVMA